MSYLPAYRITDDDGTRWLFMRCRSCAAILSETDLATHDSFHELLTVAFEAISSHAREITELRGPMVEIGDPLFNEDGTPWRPST